MPDHTSILSSDRFLRVRQMMPLVMILLIAAVPIFQGCDDDDPVSPKDPTTTPVPSVTPEPTTTPMYNGRWSGSAWSEHPTGCFEGSISFEVHGEAITNGLATFCVTRPYSSFPITSIDVPFEAVIAENGFRVYHFDGNYMWGYYTWTIEGCFDSTGHISGTWLYDSGAVGESGPYGHGGWMADRH